METTTAPETQVPAAPPAPRRTRKAAATAKSKPAPKGKATAAKARTPIPAGMTRSRGALIPKATGTCGFTGAKGQCANPGRWTRTVDGQPVLSCTTHKNAAKVAVFAPKARRTRRAKATA